MKVVDGSGKPLSSVEVYMTLDWGDKKPLLAAQNTQDDGVARFSKKKASTGQYTATVTDLILAGFTWIRVKV